MIGEKVGMKTILLKFSGPLQSWGTSSHFEIRHTDKYPSKSAVVGLIAAALGYRRNEDEKIRELGHIHYAVRIDQAGHVVDDYQTVHKSRYTPEKTLDRTYVTHREYIEDAVFVVAIGSDDITLVDKILQALQNPYFQLSEGRRSCPLMVDCFIGNSDTDVISALKEVSWQASEWYQKKGKWGKKNDNTEGSVVLEIIADADLLPEGKPASLRRDVPLSFSNKGRRYSYRNERRIQVTVKTGLSAKTEHDAFGII